MPRTRSNTTRRHFLGTTAATAVAGSLATPATGTVDNQAGTASPRKRIAIITTLWAYLRHGQHIGDRFLVGYPWEGALAIPGDTPPDEEDSSNTYH